MPHVHAKAPCRVDLFGGTLDLWPLYLWFQPSVTVNLAVTIFTEVDVETQPSGSSVELSVDVGTPQLKTLPFPYDPQTVPDPWKLAANVVHHFASRSGGTFRVKTSSQAPVGSGLAASSSQVVALTSALNQATGAGYTQTALQRLSRDLETQVINAPGGEQDFYPALFGGLGILSLEPGGVTHSQVSQLLEYFETHLVVFYTGTSHHSGLTNWEIFKAVVEKDARTVQTLSALSRNSVGGLKALRQGQIDTLLEHIHQDWEIRRKAFPVLETPAMAAAYSKSMMNSLLPT
jgi:D-glycero-alpha-D-manno-heptose-7-phosphate kinase